MKPIPKILTLFFVVSGLLSVYQLSKPPVTGDARLDEVVHDLDDMKDAVVAYWRKNCKFPNALPPSMAQVCAGGSLCVTDDLAKQKWASIGIELRDSSYFTYESTVLRTPKSHQYSLIARADGVHGGPVHRVKLNIVGTFNGCGVHVLEPFHKHINE